MSNVTWHRVKIHAEQRIESLRSALEVAADQNAVTNLQAEIKVWREILALPAILAAEAEQSPQAGYA